MPEDGSPDDLVASLKRMLLSSPAERVTAVSRVWDDLGVAELGDLLQAALAAHASLPNDDRPFRPSNSEMAQIRSLLCAMPPDRRAIGILATSTVYGLSAETGDWPWIGDEATVQELLDLLYRPISPEVWTAACRIIVLTGQAWAVPQLVTWAAHLPDDMIGKWGPAYYLTLAFRAHASDSQRQTLVELALSSGSGRSRRLAIESLSEKSHPTDADVMIEAMRDPDLSVRLAAATALSEWEHPRAVPALRDLGSQAAPEFYGAVCDELMMCDTRTGGEQGAAVLDGFWRESDWHAADDQCRARVALSYLCAVPHGVALASFAAAAQHRLPSVRRCALQACLDRAYEFSGEPRADALIDAVHRQDAEAIQEALLAFPTLFARGDLG